jgi:hypothetical protein
MLLRCGPVLFVFMGLQAEAQTCLAPSRPFVPSDAADARRFADLIRQDFETYLADVQAYFRCLEEERTRAIAEAREVTKQYRRFLETVGR